MTRRRRKREIATGGEPPGSVSADTTKQVPVHGYSGYKKFYVDVQFRCKDCGKPEVWAAKDQKWFYEEAKGSLYATAVRCRKCRKKLRASKEIQRQQMKSAAASKRKP